MAVVRLISSAVRAIADRRRSGRATEAADDEPAMAGTSAPVAARTAGGTLTAAGTGEPSATSADLAGPAPGGIDPGPPESGPLEPGQAEPGQAGRGQPGARRRTARELVALGWIWAAVAASYVFGFEIGVPVIAAAYCLTSISWSRRWQRLTFAAAVTGTAFVIALGFVSLFHLTFSGLLA
jgi:hypothetical protein